MMLPGDCPGWPVRACRAGAVGVSRRIRLPAVMYRSPQAFPRNSARILPVAGVPVRMVCMSVPARPGVMSMAQEWAFVHTHREL